MFAPHCPRCQTRVLLGTRRIVRAEGGRAIVLRCWCGQLVVDDLGGAAPTPPSDATEETGPPPPRAMAPEAVAPLTATPALAVAG